MEVNHKYLHQTLCDRGIPSPGHASIKGVLESLTQADHQRLQSVAGQLAKGVESDADYQWLRALLDSPASNLVGVGKGAVPSITSTAPLEAPKARAVRKKSYGEVKAHLPKHHVYGLRGALTFEMDSARTPSEAGGEGLTISLEGANALSPKKFDWERKITFQFSLAELPLLACCLLGYLTAPLNLGNHGPSRDKFLQMGDSGAGLLVEMRQTNAKVMVPIGPADLYACTDLVLHALSANSPTISGAMQLEMLKRVAAMQNRKKDAKPFSS